MAQAGVRKLAAILAADMVGYSRLVGADEEGTIDRLRQLRRELIDPSVAQNRGGSTTLANSTTSRRRRS